MSFSRRRSSICNQKDVLIPVALAVGAFLFGLIFGALTLHNLNPLIQEDLRQYLTAFLEGAAAASGNRLAGFKIWCEIIKLQTVTLGLLWLFGLTVVGIPLIFIIIGARGFILGFTVGFLVQEKAGQGLLLSLAGVFPQNLFYIPAYLGAGILAVYFSLSLLRGFRDGTVSSRLGIYSLFFLLFFLFILVGAWIEVYLVPGLLRLLNSLCL
jgi:stage II sporulation protein M